MYLSLPFLQGLNFLDTLSDVWTQCKFDSQAFDPECTKWLLLLLQLVDVTGDNPHIHYRRFILAKTGVVKKYRQEVKKHVSALVCVCGRNL